MKANEDCVRSNGNCQYVANEATKVYNFEENDKFQRITKTTYLAVCMQKQ